MNYKKVLRSIKSSGGIIGAEDVTGNLRKTIISFPDEKDKKDWFNYFYKNGQVSEHDALVNLLKIYINDTGQWHLSGDWCNL